MTGAKSRNGDGRLCVLDGTFAASSYDGGLTWAPGIAFHINDDDEFVGVSDPETAGLLSAAVAAVGRA